MKIKEKLQILLSYYISTRGAGHTTLLKEGTRNYNRDKLALIFSMKESKEVECLPKDCVSWNALEKLRGCDKPLAIDNHVQMKIVSETLEELLNLENNLATEESLNGKLRDLVDLVREQRDNYKEVLKYSQEHPWKTFFEAILKKFSNIRTQHLYN